MLPRTVDGLSVVVALKRKSQSFLSILKNSNRSELIKSKSMADSFSDGRGTDG